MIDIIAYQIRSDTRNIIVITSKQLKSLLGQPLTYQGLPCCIIDILDEEPALVLQDCSSQRVIQSNQHGEASRRVSRTFTVALLNVRRDALNPLLEGLPNLEGLPKLLANPD